MSEYACTCVCACVCVCVRCVCVCVCVWCACACVHTCMCVHMFGKRILDTATCTQYMYTHNSYTECQYMSNQHQHV